MKEIKILGGHSEFSGKPQILDKDTKQEQQTVEVRLQEELVTEDEKLRKERKEGDPEVRIRHIPPTMLGHDDD